MALSFNGSSQYVNCTTAAATSMPITIACWFRANTVPLASFQCLFQINNNAGSASSAYRLIIPSNTTALRAAQATTGTIVNADSSSGVLSSNVWAHGAGVFSSTTSRTVYVNGSAGSTNTTSLAAPTVTTMNLGAVVTNTSTAGTFLAGRLAEVGVWSAALTAGEIASLSRGVCCNHVRPQSLVFYAPLIRDLVDAARGLTISNINAATVADHPRVYA